MSATRHHTMLPQRGQGPDHDGAPEPGTLLIEDETLRAGFTQIPNRVLHARNLSRDAKLLYGFLLSYAWQQGRCFPGYAQLCVAMGASPSIVRKYMRELEAVGLLVQKRRGLGKTNLYTLCSLSRATLEPPLPPRRAETDDQERGSLVSDDQDCGSLVSNDQDALLSDALESNPCSGKEDSTEKDTNEEGFDSKGTTPPAEHADDGAVRQPIKGQPRGAGRGKARRPAAPASEHIVPTLPPTEAAPPVPDVVLPLSDDQALVVLLAQLGDEFGDRATRSSLTRVRTRRQRHCLGVEETIRHLDDAARLTRACRTVQPDKRMAYLLTVLENRMAAPPPAVVPPGTSSEQRRRDRPAPPAPSDRQGISRYTGGSYGVCEYCLSSPCEADCPTRTHEAAGSTAASMARAVVQLPEMAHNGYAYS